jgi:hypothetical protein
MSEYTEWEQDLLKQVDIAQERLFATTRMEECGHCYQTGVWLIESTTASGGIWNDYECDVHARRWWPHLFPALEA